MFPVPAPAAACDHSEGHEPDNAPHKNELKLVSINYFDLPLTENVTAGSAEAETEETADAGTSPETEADVEAEVAADAVAHADTETEADSGTETDAETKLPAGAETPSVTAAEPEAEPEANVETQTTQGTALRSEADTLQTSSESDPSSLAARILQMHAASGVLEQRQTARRPQLVGTAEDAAFDIPGVLQRPSPVRRSSGLNPDPVPAPKSTPSFSARLRRGPSFGALVASTLLIVAVGSGAVLFGLTDLLAGNPAQEEMAQDRFVSTQLIAAEPTIESIIAESDSETLGQSNLTSAPAASPEQVAMAKDRIRQAFAAGGRASASPLDPADPTSSAAVDPEEIKIQARLVPAGSDAAQAAASQISSPPLASADALPTAGNPVPARPGLDPDAAVAGRKESNDQAQASAASSGSFTDTGKILVSVNLRQAQDKDAPVIAVVPANSAVSVGKCGSWWCEVAFDGKQGFVGQKYVERQQ